MLDGSDLSQNLTLSSKTGLIYGFDEGFVKIRDIEKIQQEEKNQII
jgi:hypothetical protein